MENYFAKLIVVKGEPKKGDWYLSRFRMGNKFFHFAQWDTPETPYFGTPMKDDFMGKAKLFVCTHEINTGDWVRIHRTKDDYKNGHYEDGYLVVGAKGEHELIVEHKSWEDGVNISIPRNYALKVLGEVSPEAGWVKHGDKFKEDQIAELKAIKVEANSHAHKHEDFVILGCQETYNPSEIREALANWREDPGNFGIISARTVGEPYTLWVRILGPCGHWH